MYNYNNEGFKSKYFFQNIIEGAQIVDFMGISRVQKGFMSSSYIYRRRRRRSRRLEGERKGRGMGLSSSSCNSSHIDGDADLTLSVWEAELP